ncbi:MAG: LptF/LptG family permease [Spirochaetaceae bacterium]|uniref:YjgP/YjgQ family permease n=1 Tax=Sphaerochaeta halotolerans TaxID=2293840 RepID=A0A372MFQ3_9SPIR|nr:LptF/LptG family permease [Sphaerochaeta halotolerans]MBG0766224.1 LptF/LptG family permease [Spirochaetaceae bacterium]RFU94617.1 YjgP/YjgQ family permease [Sphaerochaeta halotolerans]
MKQGARFNLVYRHIGREYLLSFIVAFFFFFFIFFINQILLIAQRILLKQVDYFSVFQLVLLSIPQFLLYTFPFSSLTASSMVIGDLSDNNEILAIRSSGISLKHVFLPIILISLIFSLMTFLTADKALPWSTKKYRELYSGLMRELPTLELASNTTNTIGNKVLVNKEVVGNTVHDIVLFETSNDRSGQIISAPTAEVTLYDLNAFIYQLDLENPLMLRNDGDSQWALSKADSARFFLNFSGQIASLASALPSQLSIKELQENIAIHRSALEKETARYEEKLQKARLNLATLTQQEMVSPERVEEAAQEVSNLEKKKPINFYYQYYRAELHKKFALSAACFMLVFLTFSFSFFKVKHGRLIGFGMSMLVAVLYWYLLFFSQMQIFKFPIHPGLLIWIPNVLMFLSGVLIMLFARRL